MSRVLIPLMFTTGLCAVLVQASSAVAADQRTLSWNGKQTAPKAETYAVPPSPYGEVGNFYRKDLNWNGKATTPSPKSAPKPVIVAAKITPTTETVRPQTRAYALPERYVPEPVQPYVYRSVPQVAGYKPEAIAPVASLTIPPMLPAPTPTVRALPPEVGPAEVRPEPQPLSVVKQPPIARTAPKPEPTKPEPRPPVVTAAVTPTMTAPTDPNAYQMPATSKYYRAPAAPTAPGEVPKDHVFVPGETITDPATQSPRYYSLHRNFGLTPDAITIPSEYTTEDLPVATEASPPK